MHWGMFTEHGVISTQSWHRDSAARLYRVGGTWDCTQRCPFPIGWIARGVCLAFFATCNDDRWYWYYRPKPIFSNRSLLIAPKFIYWYATNHDMGISWKNCKYTMCHIFERRFVGDCCGNSAVSHWTLLDCYLDTLNRVFLCTTWQCFFWPRKAPIRKYVWVVVLLNFNIADAFELLFSLLGEDGLEDALPCLCQNCFMQEPGWADSRHDRPLCCFSLLELWLKSVMYIKTTVFTIFFRAFRKPMRELVVL